VFIFANPGEQFVIEMDIIAFKSLPNKNVCYKAFRCILIEFICKYITKLFAVLNLHNYFFRMLESNKGTGALDINCCDPLGRTALLMAIDNENLEIIEMLIDNKVKYSFLLQFIICNNGYFQVLLNDNISTLI
jgi:hypothetical protein